MDLITILTNAGVTEDIITKVNEELEKVQMIPKSRLDQVLEQKRTLEGQLTDRDTQLESLKGQVKDSVELTQTIETLQADNQAAIEALQEQMKEQQFNHLLENSLQGKVKNAKAAKALLDLEKIKVDGESLIGLEEQLKGLKESDPYLFVEEQKQKNLGSLGNFQRKETPSGGESLGARLAKEKQEAAKQNASQNHNYFGS